MSQQMSQPLLNIYRQFDTDFCTLLEENGLEYIDASHLTTLGKSILRTRKHSVSAMQRVYFPDFSIESTLKCLSNLHPHFHAINHAMLKRIALTWSKSSPLFLICDDFLVSRYTKKAYRCGLYRDPVKRTFGYGHNIVDTVITNRKIDFTFEFSIPPKGSKIPKTKRGLRHLQHALSFLELVNFPFSSIRLLLDGGYSNQPVLLPIQKLGIKYMGTIRRDKKFRLFKDKAQLQHHFSEFPTHYKKIQGTKYWYERHTLNLTDLGRHQVFHVWRVGEKEGKYVVTNDLKMTPTTFLTGINDRWLVEQSHRDLKQFCGLKTMFVRKRRPVQGWIALGYLVKNFLALCLAENDRSIREYPFETLIEKEFTLFEQDLINLAIRLGIIEN